MEAVRSFELCASTCHSSVVSYVIHYCRFRICVPRGPYMEFVPLDRGWKIMFDLGLDLSISN
jgi:hypothetical protein